MSLLSESAPFPCSITKPYEFGNLDRSATTPSRMFGHKKAVLPPPFSALRVLAIFGILVVTVACCSVAVFHAAPTTRGAEAHRLIVAGQGIETAAFPVHKPLPLPLQRARDWPFGWYFGCHSDRQRRELCEDSVVNAGRPQAVDVMGDDKYKFTSTRVTVRGRGLAYAREALKHSIRAFDSSTRITTVRDLSGCFDALTSKWTRGLELSALDSSTSLITAATAKLEVKVCQSKDNLWWFFKNIGKANSGNVTAAKWREGMATVLTHDVPRVSLQKQLAYPYSDGFVDYRTFLNKMRNRTVIEGLKNTKMGWEKQMVLAVLFVLAVTCWTRMSRLKGFGRTFFSIHKTSPDVQCFLRGLILVLALTIGASAQAVSRSQLDALISAEDWSAVEAADTSSITDMSSLFYESPFSMI
mmetsp:Transcript_30425/g.62732  ORF Transcript_30425/g.62732 Transcript_30425/m.62732 type:complete len:413 (-) Transcript_30425:116-1354(-)